MDRNARILLTGASGVLGYNMVEYLHKKGYDNLKLLDIVEPRQAYSRPYEFIQCDITNPDLDPEIMRGVDVVVHCASAAPSYPAAQIQSIVIDGTERLLKLASQNECSRFIYISSTAVYGIPNQVPLTETAELQDYHDPYNRAKIQAEKQCLHYRDNGMCIPILRPRTFLGPGRLGTFAMLNDWALSGKNFPLLGRGDNKYQFLDVEDLCQAIFLCIENDRETVNDTFNIGAREFQSIREDYQAVLDAAGFGKRIVLLPAGPALLILRLMERFRLMPLYKRLYEKIVMDYYVSIDKAERVLGYQPQYSNSDTLIRCYRWYCENLASFKNSSGAANSEPWRQGIFGLLKPLF
ncbi:MAG: NAD-dependent epimerase/dehydratase family protein [Pseudomonadales bacterium]|nr:NAD-dependent epimerase/dehydratase family protein [Pseudomonadales bacterium]